MHDEEALRIEYIQNDFCVLNPTIVGQEGMVTERVNVGATRYTAESTVDSNTPNDGIVGALGRHKFLEQASNVRRSLEE